MLTQPDPSHELEQLASMVRQMRPDGRNPEPFYETRSEVVAALLRLSRRLAGKAMPAPMPIPLRRPVVARAVAARIPMVVAAPPPPRRIVRPRHRYPRPPVLPPTIQPQLL